MSCSNVLYDIGVRDYIALSQTTFLTRLQPTQTITFQIVDDVVLEDPESFIFVANLLSEDISGIILDPVREVFIIDNDRKLH